MDRTDHFRSHPLTSARSSMTVMGVKNWIAVSSALAISAALAACAPRTADRVVAPTLPPEKPLQTSADVAWSGPGKSAGECGSFVVSFRFAAIDPRTVAKVRGRQMTIRLNTAVGKKPGSHSSRKPIVRYTVLTAFSRFEENEPAIASAT